MTATSAVSVSGGNRRERATGGFSIRPLWALYQLTLQQYLHGRRWIVIGALFTLPAALSILLRATASKVPPVGLEFILVFMLLPQAILPIVALLYGSAMIQDEQEEQTITYLLVRPLPKWALYVIKLLATMTTCILLMSVFVALTYAVIYLGAASDVPDVPLRCLTAIFVHSLALIAYSSIFGLISLITKRSIVLGIVYIVAVEGVLANMPFGIRLMTVVYYARLVAYRMLEFVVTRPHGQENIAADAWQLNLRQDPALAQHPQLGTCILVLLLASLVCTVLAALVFSRREFHVKTPEGS
jgi:ABC-2 type transport system permease protein